MIIYRNEEDYMLDYFITDSKLFDKLVLLEENFNYDFSLSENTSAYEIELEVLKDDITYNYTIDYYLEIEEKPEDYFSFSDFEYHNVIDTRDSDIIIREIIKDIIRMKKKLKKEEE